MRQVGRNRGLFRTWERQTASAKRVIMDYVQKVAACNLFGINIFIKDQSILSVDHLTSH